MATKTRTFVFSDDEGVRLFKEAIDEYDKKNKHILVEWFDNYTVPKGYKNSGKTYKAVKFNADFATMSDLMERCGITMHPGKPYNKLEKLKLYLYENRTNIAIAGVVFASGCVCAAIGYMAGFDDGREYSVKACNEIIEACLGPGKLEFTSF